MAKKRPSIADKVDDIFREKEEPIEDYIDVDDKKGLIPIPIDRIIPSPNQPRKTFYEQTISELAESIKERGVLSPIIVRPKGNKYEIIAGERRFKAAGQAGLKEIPAIIKKASDGDSRIISLIENIQREDLNDIDRASALRELKVNLGSPWEVIAKKLGLTKRRVLDLVGLLDLPEEIKEDIRQKKLTERHGRALRQLLDRAEVLRDVFSFIKDKKLTGEQTQELVQAIKSEPRFTIDEVYNNLITCRPKPKIKKELVEIIVSISQSLIKNIHQLNINNLEDREKEELKKNLLAATKEIQNIIKIF